MLFVPPNKPEVVFGPLEMFWAPKTGIIGAGAKGLFVLASFASPPKTLERGIFEGLEKIEPDGTFPS